MRVRFKVTMSLTTPRSAVPFTDWEIRDQILLGRELGRGSYGRVLEGEWKGAKVAVKMVHDIFLEVGLPSSDVTTFLSKFEAEWETMKSLRHPNVLQLFGVSNPKSTHAKMVMELMDESLEHRIEKGPALSSAQKLHVIKSIACGLRYLHELPCPVIHRDLASKNILLSRDAIQVKLGDLGVAKFLTELHTGQGTVMPGTELYMPPEVRSEMEPHPSLDIFSFGVIMIEIIVGQLPAPLPLLARDSMSSGSFRVLTELERREKDIKRVSKDHPLHPVILLALDLPEVRPSAAQVLESLAGVREYVTMNDEDSASDSSTHLALLQEIQELEIEKDRLESQNRDQRNEIEQLHSEIATLKSRNVQAFQQSESSQVCHYPFDEADTPHYSGVTAKCDPMLQLDLTNTRYSGVKVESVDGCRLTYNRQNNAVGVFQSLAYPFGSKFTYYQVQIINYGTRGTIGIGLAHKEYALNRQPGWDKASIGYHCDDGRLFYENGSGHCIYSAAQQGDIIGCGVSNIIYSNPCRAVVFFTHNRLKLGEITVIVPDGGLYPTVGLHSQGEVVNIDCESKWNDSSCSKGMNRLRHELVFVKGNEVAYVGNQANDVGVFQVCDRPMNHSFSYYEVTVMDEGFRGTIGIGLARHDYPFKNQPGWATGSVAYHCDDGKLYLESGQGWKFYQPIKRGDTIGCGISSFQRSCQKATVFFTHNNSKIGTVIVAIPHGGLFPTVGLHSTGEVVKLNVAVSWNDTHSSLQLFTASNRFERVEVAGNTIRYKENQRNEVGVFQVIKQPLTPSQPYFEVHIVKEGEQCAIGVGIARKDYPLNKQPGWRHGSVAYHCDDGKLYKESGSRHFSEAAKKGDVVGCGISSFSPQAVVFFTKNRMKIGETMIALPSGGFFPTVGLHSRGEVVKINLAAQWTTR